MRSQAALGERGRALRHYEELVELLDEQLGTAPAPETSAPHERLRVLADRSARRWILAEMIAFFAWGAHLAFTGAFLAERHGVAESATGILLALGAAAFFVTSVRGAPLLGRLPRPRLVAAAALVIGVLIALQFNTHAAVWIALVAWFCAPPQAGSEPPSFLCWDWLSSRTSPAR
jgi:predicted MFS family arabinose efflux permease